MIINGYFKSEKFLTLKNKVANHIKECNDLNDHIEELKLSYNYANSTDYGEGRLSDTSRYNMKRSQWSTQQNNRWNYSCTLAIVKNASDQPFKYFCKYFNISSDEKTLEKFESVLNDFSAVEQGKNLLIKERDEIVASISNSIPSYIMNKYKERVNRELGFHAINLSDVYFPVYTFQYVSAGGNSSSRFDLKLDNNMLERFIGYLAGLVQFRNSAAGQRALMTASLRERIKRRDNFTCQKCGLSIADEKHLLLEIDHIIPISKGGITTENNLQTLCWKCNRSKGSKVETPLINSQTQSVSQAIGNDISNSFNIPQPLIQNNQDLAQPYLQTENNVLNVEKSKQSNVSNFDNHISNQNNVNLSNTTLIDSSTNEPPIQKSKINYTKATKKIEDEAVNHSDTSVSTKQDTIINNDDSLNIETPKKSKIDYTKTAKKSEYENESDLVQYTKSQKNCLRSAKEWLDYAGYSRNRLIEMLCESDSYSKKDATLVVDSLNINWQTQAVRTAKDWLDYAGYSRNRLIEMLCESDGYTEKEATSAVDSLNVDWQAQAVRTAKDWLDYAGYSRNRLIEMLCESDGYTEKEATSAVDNLDINWSEQGVRTVEQYLEYSGYSRKRLIEMLCEDDLYTNNEAIYAVDKVGLD